MSERAELYRRLPVTTTDRWWLQLAAASPDGRVLELGAGTGRLTAALAAQGLEVTAVERDPAMVAVLRAHLATRGVRAQVVSGDVTDRPDLGTHGCVLAPTSLLNELPDAAARRGTLAAAAAACAPGGRVGLHLLGPWWLARASGEVVGRLVPADAAEAEVEVTLRLGALTPAGRRSAELAYRFADGTVHHDALDAAVITPGELEALCGHVGLTVVERWGAVPGGGEPHLDDPVWHLVARPDR